MVSSAIAILAADAANASRSLASFLAVSTRPRSAARRAASSRHLAADVRRYESARSASASPCERFASVPMAESSSWIDVATRVISTGADSATLATDRSSSRALTDRVLNSTHSSARRSASTAADASCDSARERSSRARWPRSRCVATGSSNFSNVRASASASSASLETSRCLRIASSADARNSSDRSISAVAIDAAVRSAADAAARTSFKSCSARTVFSSTSLKTPSASTTAAANASAFCALNPGSDASSRPYAAASAARSTWTRADRVADSARRRSVSTFCLATSDSATDASNLAAAVPTASLAAAASSEEARAVSPAVFSAASACAIAMSLALSDASASARSRLASRRINESFSSRAAAAAASSDVAAAATSRSARSSRFAQKLSTASAARAVATDSAASASASHRRLYASSRQFRVALKPLTADSNPSTAERAASLRSTADVAAFPCVSASARASAASRSRALAIAMDASASLRISDTVSGSASMFRAASSARRLRESAAALAFVTFAAASFADTSDASARARASWTSSATASATCAIPAAADAIAFAAAAAASAAIASRVASTAADAAVSARCSALASAAAHFASASASVGEEASIGDGGEWRARSRRDDATAPAVSLASFCAALALETLASDSCARICASRAASRASVRALRATSSVPTASFTRVTSAGSNAGKGGTCGASSSVTAPIPARIFPAPGVSKTRIAAARFRAASSSSVVSCSSPSPSNAPEPFCRTFRRCSSASLVRRTAAPEPLYPSSSSSISSTASRRNLRMCGDASDTQRQSASVARYRSRPSVFRSAAAASAAATRRRLPLNSKLVSRVASSARALTSLGLRAASRRALAAAVFVGSPGIAASSFSFLNASRHARSLQT